MTNPGFRGGIALLASLLTGLLGAQPLALPNPGFEAGGDEPAGWRFLAGMAPGETPANQVVQPLAPITTRSPGEGKRSLHITGNGNTVYYWRTPDLKLEAGGLYHLRFRARREATLGGPLVAGAAFANRDFYDELSPGWQQYRMLLHVPTEGLEDWRWVRFGQWRAQGSYQVDEVSLVPVQAVHARRGPLELGEGERIAGNQYQFRSNLEFRLQPHARTLQAHRAFFNTARWVLGRDSFVTYRHQLPGRRHLAASFSVEMPYHHQDRLAVEVGTEAGGWRIVGYLAKRMVGEFDVPADLLPAADIRVRLRAESDWPLQADSDMGAFTLTNYIFKSQLDGEPIAFTGHTHYFDILASQPDAPVRLLEFDEPRPGHATALRLEGPAEKSGGIPAIEVAGARPAGPAQSEPASSGDRSRWRVPYAVEKTGPNLITVRVPGAAQFVARLETWISELRDASYGALLPGGNAGVALWSASSGWKIDRERPLPTTAASALRVELAANEAEAVQLVLTPRANLPGVRVEPGALMNAAGWTLPATQVAVLRVAYLNVEIPVDHTSTAAWWPDPLPPLTGPLDLAGGMNHPFWLCVTVPPGTPAGTYRGEVKITAEGFAAAVPLEVEVFGFELPRVPTIRSGIGLSAATVALWHGVTDSADQRRLLDLYFETYRSHRLSPYDPAPWDPFTIRWPEVPPGRDATALAQLDVQIDFAAWDRALARAFGEFNFTGIRMNLPGLGNLGGGRQSKPQLMGIGEDDPAYLALFRAAARRIDEHLTQRGWADRVFVYWADEPAVHDLPFVKRGLDKISTHAPHLPGFITTAVHPGLVGAARIWCPITPAYDEQASRARQKLGEEIWWYVCTAPKAPYPTLFIDHPATDLRVWLWQTWQRDIEGVLIWRSDRWPHLGDDNHPRENPYISPMTWVHNHIPDHIPKQGHGNGDGRLLYPPEEVAAGRGRGLVAPPVVSIRWEMLRDGIEDCDYLALLRDRLAAAGDRLDPVARAALADLLIVPAEITGTITAYTRDPAPIEARRRAVARGIEQLDRLLRP